VVMLVLMIYCCRWYTYYYCGWCLISDLYISISWSVLLIIIIDFGSPIPEATGHIQHHKWQKEGSRTLGKDPLFGIGLLFDIKTGRYPPPVTRTP
jgi:hypothetical protein